MDTDEDNEMADWPEWSLDGAGEAGRGGMTTARRKMLALRLEMLAWARRELADECRGEGMTQQEIAVFVGVTKSAIAASERRALRKLRNQLRRIERGERI